mmetsp:Transcript_19997/g.33477  ORF Transcript_19997/g.33477 Transcript_19997/m.33477 type:complete len:179 (+) Transcript_19997:96-632(+)
MRGFHFYVQLLVTQNVEDTQCGFKLFTRSAGKMLFKYLHLYRWAFDTEIIYLAELLHIPMAEVAVNWREVDGSKLIQSKLDVVTTSITMARDILCMRLSYLLHLWDSPPPPPPPLRTGTTTTTTTTNTATASSSSGDGGGDSGGNSGDHQIAASSSNTAATGTGDSSRRTTDTHNSEF